MKKCTITLIMTLKWKNFFRNLLYINVSNNIDLWKVKILKLKAHWWDVFHYFININFRKRSDIIGLVVHNFLTDRPTKLCITLRKSEITPLFSGFNLFVYFEKYFILKIKIKWMKMKYLKCLFFIRFIWSPIFMYNNVTEYRNLCWNIYLKDHIPINILI